MTCSPGAPLEANCKATANSCRVPNRYTGSIRLAEFFLQDQLPRRGPTEHPQLRPAQTRLDSGVRVLVLRCLCTVPVASQLHNRLQKTVAHLARGAQQVRKSGSQEVRKVILSRSKPYVRHVQVHVQRGVHVHVHVHVQVPRARARACACACACACTCMCMRVHARDLHAVRRYVRSSDTYRVPQPG